MHLRVKITDDDHPENKGIEFSGRTPQEYLEIFSQVIDVINRRIERENLANLRESPASDLPDPDQS